MILEDIREAVKNGQYKVTETLISEAISLHIPADRILEESMIPAMQETGENYKMNEIDIPRILASARCMRIGMDLLLPYLNTEHGFYIGTAILGTVEGDLHDIGKNLVAVMFRCAGFRVVDLGVNVTEKQFLRAIDQNPDASVVCISSLLTTTQKNIRHTVKTLRQSDTEHRLKIMVGGGAVTSEFASMIGADAYTETAVDAARRARAFIV